MERMYLNDVRRVKGGRWRIATPAATYEQPHPILDHLRISQATVLAKLREYPRHMPYVFVAVDDTCTEYTVMAFGSDIDVRQRGIETAATSARAHAARRRARERRRAERMAMERNCA